MSTPSYNRRFAPPPDDSPDFLGSQDENASRSPQKMVARGRRPPCRVPGFRALLDPDTPLQSAALQRTEAAEACTETTIFRFVEGANHPPRVSAPLIPSILDEVKRNPFYYKSPGLHREEQDIAVCARSSLSNTLQVEVHRAEQLSR